MTQAMTATRPAGKTAPKGSAKPAAKSAKTASVEKAPMHRVGLEKGMITDPVNLQERLISRRLGLKMSQQDVAEKITFWNQKQKEWKTLSRSAYCMYESGEVVPDLDKIERLAVVLKCTPQWLAFGLGTPSAIDEVEWDGKTKTFKKRRVWNIDDGWLMDRFDAGMSELVLVTVDEFAPNMKPGDVAFVIKGQEPSRASDIFAFSDDGEVKVAHVTRPSPKGPYRVYSDDRKEHVEVPAKRLTFLGRVVGKVGGI